MNEFLEPKSMLTPGIAGSLTMTLTNALSISFGLPSPQVALGISFLLSAALLFTRQFSAQLILFWVLNSLVIFSTAVGTNSIGQFVAASEGIGKAEAAIVLAQAPPQPPPTPPPTPAEKFFKPWLQGK